MNERRDWRPEPVIAKKTYNGITIGYIVGWPHIYGNMVRNIRANLIFPNATKARNFKRRMESQRVSAYAKFEIIKDET